MFRKILITFNKVWAQNLLDCDQVTGDTDFKWDTNPVLLGETVQIPSWIHVYLRSRLGLFQLVLQVVLSSAEVLRRASCTALREWRR